MNYGNNLMINITDPSKWLEINQNILGNRLINQIIIPGTHNSVAYTICDDQFTELPLKYKIFSNTIFSKWAITQSYTILEQLRMGVRYLDLRISFAPSQIGLNRFYASHTFALITLTSFLDQVKQFLTESPNEFLIINTRIDHLQQNKNNITDTLKHDALEYIKYSLNTLLVPKQIFFPTYNEVLNNGIARIFLFTANLWLPSMIHIPWIDTYDIETKVNFTIEHQKHFQPTKLNGLSATITPNLNTILQHTFTMGLTNNFNDNTHSIQSIILDHAKLNNQFISLIETDFINQNYINNIILLNNK